MDRSLARVVRSARAGLPVAGAIRQLSWSQPRLTYRPVEILSADQIEAIHQASLGVLERWA
jgi:trimethylamine--corrinoid protein Co-methyltransferase